MKRMLYSLLVATLPFGSILADTPREKNAKVILVLLAPGPIARSPSCPSPPA